MMEMVLDKSIDNNSVERIDYVENGIYFTIKTKCISKHQDKYMMAITLYTFESDKEERKTDDILRFNQSVFLTYGIVVLLCPSTNRSEVLFSQGAYNNEYAGMKLDESVAQIAERESVKRTEKDIRSSWNCLHWEPGSMQQVRSLYNNCSVSMV